MALAPDLSTTPRPVTERIKFRLIWTPCCGHLLCWVNPRLPNFCPECGAGIIAALRADGTRTLQTDDNATLEFHVAQSQL